MILTSAWHIFWIGVAGGLLGELLTLYELSRNDPSTRPKMRRDPFYWVVSIVMAFLGGALAVAYGFKEVQIFAVLNIGASAPVLIKNTFSGFAPPATPKIG